MKYISLVLLAVILISSLSLASCRLAYQKGQEDASQSGSSSTQGGATANQPPMARIVDIHPPMAYLGFPVYFKGEGIDADGTVKTYLWKSSIDGVLSREASFVTDKLSIGTHIISFQVMDNDDAKSQEITAQLVIKGN